MRIGVLIALLFASPAFAAKPTGSNCSTSPASLAYPDRTGWHLTATVPAKANVHVIVTGAGAPTNEWTNVRGSRQGNTQTINDAYLTTLFTTTGSATVELVDVHQDGTFDPITTCTLDVLAGLTEGKESTWR